MKVALFTLSAVLLVLSVDVHAQSKYRRYHVLAPSQIHLKVTGGLPAETVRLMWDRSPEIDTTENSLWRKGLRPHPSLVAGADVEREVSLKDPADGMTYTFSFDGPPLSATPTIPDTPSQALIVPGPLATVHVDAKDPSILHVNHWIANSRSCAEIEGKRVCLDAETMRGIDYFYQLKNRQTVSFDFAAWRLGALSIPVKWRPGSGGASSDFSTDINAGVIVGRTWGDVRYTYERHASNGLESWLGRGVAAFAGFSVVSVDSTNSRLGGNPLTEKTEILTFSPGVGVTLTVLGVDLGLFGGIEWAVPGISPEGSRWDYHNSLWVGFGAGFNVFKLSDK